MERPGAKPSKASTELSIYKQHRPRAALRPVAAVRLAVVSVSPSAPASESAPASDSDPARADEATELRLLNEPALATPSDPAASAPCLDARILAILTSGPAQGETLDAAFRRKERELGALFATLSVSASRALHRRLSMPGDDDLVAARFGQLIAERRARLLAFLADARRREAIARG